MIVICKVEYNVEALIVSYQNRWYVRTSEDCHPEIGIGPANRFLSCTACNATLIRPPRPPGVVRPFGCNRTSANEEFRFIHKEKRFKERSLLLGLGWAQKSGLIAYGPLT